MKRSNLTAMGMAAALMITGCATQKVLQATGGSRADGIVELSYEYGQLEVPQVDVEQGLVVARQRCAAWGYGNAEAFGGQTNQCRGQDLYGNCNITVVTVKYQCIDKSP